MKVFRNLRKFNFLSTRKLIPSLILNLLGIQIFRVLLAWVISKLNRGVKGQNLDLDFEKNGFLRLEQFLSCEEFDRLAEDVINLVENVPSAVRRIDGSNTYENWGPDQYLSFGNINSFFYSQYFRENLERIIGKKNIKEENLVLLVERLTQGTDFIEDPETQIHEDTFHATHKGWFYITNVNLEHGPFIYYPGTHKITLNKLVNIYLNSIKKTPIASRRIFKSELMRHKEEIFLASKNTLLFADTFGFHGRLKGSEYSTRISLSFSYRPNPFF